MKNFEVKPAESLNLEIYAAHVLRTFKEYGHANLPAHPFSLSKEWDINEFINNLPKKWSVEKFCPFWEKSWAAVIEGKIVGHLNIRGGSIEAQAHRVKLGMGIETEFRGKGMGKALLEECIFWCKTQPQIEWIDLSVFEHNLPARTLYKKFGFKEIGTIEDALRVENHCINDIFMALKLK